ncbi:MAG TPA: PEP-CTERM sorting domain-containing protein [Vicinamibacterales bacterium]|nr:PEP-CTERM sorting domain-containing protein [Vicinamibacterales bacterium]
MKKLLVAVAVAIVPSMASASTFDLRNPGIEAIDEVNSFSLTVDGLTATLSALPATFDGHNLLLNQTSSGFGVNVDGTTCGSTEDSAAIDGGCVGEMIGIVFNSDVFVNSLRVSNFGVSTTLGMDAGLVTMGAYSYIIASTGLQLLGNTFLAAGDALYLSYTAGNGFSLDNFTATATSVPEPTTLALLGIGVFATTLARKRIRA